MRNGILKSDWFIGLVITLFFLIFANSNFIASIERSAYDFGVRSSEQTPSKKIAIIAIDNESIDNIGRWPWSRDVHAKMHNILAKGGTKVVGQTVFFSEPQIDPGLQFIRELKQVLQSSSIAAVPLYVEELVSTIKNSRKLVKRKRDANGRAAVKKIASTLEKSPLRYQVAKELSNYIDHINSAEVALDTDAKLAQSLKNAGNVIFYMPVVPGQAYGAPDVALPEFVTRNKIPRRNIIDNKANHKLGLFPLPVVDAFPPIAILGEQSYAIGASAPLSDVDGAIRTEPLVVDYYGDYYPSMALLLAAKSLNLNLNDIQITVGKDVKLGRLNIKTNSNSLMNTFFYHDDENYTPAFQVDSFFDVLQGKIPAEKYKDKIVLIGATALGVGDTFVTPINPSMSPVITLAHSISSILNEDFFIEPEWGVHARMGALLFVALYLMLVLPRLSAGIGFVFTSTFLLALFATHYIMMTSHGMWLQLMTPALLLAVGHTLLTTKRFFLSEKGKAQLDIESAESHRMLGLSLQGQGQLDMAFEKFRKLPLNKSVLELLYNLALDYERKRQFSKAKSVYDYMANFDTKFRDIFKRAKRAKSLDETLILSSRNSSSNSSLLTEDGVEKPMLGRYEVEREIGKGAMGAVYIGQDPKISRVVAIKTMALTQEFEDDELIKVKARFFREAETAGRLNHPNIVTIFDAGEEHDLAYIAMEFLKGSDLQKYIKPHSLLPLKQVLSIIKRAADAIDYAHQHNVVHRDLKPANVMWDPETDSCKITDFGIARITDSSKTKTGMILGTPSYMSPEQLAGEKVSGQSDIFSLGVMLFQMVTGKLPFSGDSMAALMYKIANEEHPAPESINPKLPRCVCVVINRAMNKDISKRYQRGKELSNDISRCLTIIDVEEKAKIRARQ